MPFYVPLESSARVEPGLDESGARHPRHAVRARAGGAPRRPALRACDRCGRRRGGRRSRREAQTAAADARREQRRALRWQGPLYGSRCCDCAYMDDRAQALTWQFTTAVGIAAVRIWRQAGSAPSSPSSTAPSPPIAYTEEPHDAPPPYENTSAPVRSDFARSSDLAGRGSVGASHTSAKGSAHPRPSSTAASARCRTDGADRSGVACAACSARQRCDLSA